MISSLIYSRTNVPSIFSLFVYLFNMNFNLDYGQISAKGHILSYAAY